MLTHFVKHFVEFFQMVKFQLYLLLILSNSLTLLLLLQVELGLLKCSLDVIFLLLLEEVAILDTLLTRYTQSHHLVVLL